MKKYLFGIIGLLCLAIALYLFTDEGDKKTERDEILAKAREAKAQKAAEQSEVTESEKTDV